MSRHVINLSTAWVPPVSGGTGWVRRFGRPAGVGPADRVLLVVESPGGCEISLADQVLPAVFAHQRWWHDVTGLLRARNELTVRPPLPPAAKASSAHGRLPLPEAVGRVWLEIEPAGEPA